MSSNSLPPIYYSKQTFISTDTGNLVSRQCTICSPSHIILGGTTIIEKDSVVRGDLKSVGAGGDRTSVSVGKYCVLGEGCTVRPPCRTFRGVFSYYPIKIGDYVTIGSGSVVEAAQIGNGVHIGKNCVIGSFVIIKDYARIEDNSIVAAGTVIPSFGLWAGSPGKSPPLHPQGPLANWTSFFAQMTAQMIQALPESTPELMEASARAHYARYQVG